MNGPTTQRDSDAVEERVCLLDLSVIVVNWNTRDLLADCLRSVYETVHDLAYEVFVVDNASTDGSIAMVRERFPNVHLIENSENVGFARANNQAIAQATGRYLMLLNSDATLTLNSASKMVSFCELHSDIAVLGPSLVDAQGVPQLSWAAFPSLWSELLSVHVRTKRPYPAVNMPGERAFSVDWLAGACLLVRRSTVERVGAMDEAFFLYCEETDWCLRIKESGGAIVYLPAAEAVHLEGRSSRQSSRSAWLRYDSKLIYARKHLGPAQATVLRFGFALLLCIRGSLHLLCGHDAEAKRRWQAARRLAGGSAIDA